MFTFYAPGGRRSRVKLAMRRRGDLVLRREAVRSDAAPDSSAKRA